MVSFLTYNLKVQKVVKLKVQNSRINGELMVPGSKSQTIRAVVVATLAEGKSKIINPLVSGDTLSALNAARRFGAEGVESKKCWEIRGTGGKLVKPTETVNLDNSGTSLRIFTGLAATADFPVRFDGDDSLRTRLMAPLLEALGKIGVKSESTAGKCPLTVTGPLSGGSTEVEGKSSQFLTSLLFATPLAKKDTLIKVRNLNEKPYVEMTLDWLSRQGIQLSYSDDLSKFKIKGRQAYQPFEYTVPADFSTATFALAAAAVTGGTIRIPNLDFNDPQGDKAVFGFYEDMGVQMIKKSTYTEIRSSGKLNGVEIDLNATPDALPALAVTACFAHGRTVLANVPQARIKETDRIAGITRELRKMGARITELEDGLIIEGDEKLKGTALDGYNDHRMVMALAIAGFGAEGETIISDAEAAAVTYPEFVQDFSQLGGLIQCVP